MEWTREERYRPYDQHSALELLKLQAQANNSEYQLRYHIRPTSGLLNDPNGFSYFNGEWNVFYQSFPFGATHGLKSWMRMVSKDLVHWENRGLAVAPDTNFESHGAYSGSAHVVGDQLFLMYTGNHRTADWTRIPYQVGAWLDQNGEVKKLKQPLIEQPAFASEHFRDPQLFEVNEKYYAVIGVQRQSDERGEMVLYQADQVTGAWQFVGPINTGIDDLGYMVECPNLVMVDGVPTLIFCPQGLVKDEVAYQNIYPNLVLQGESFDFTSATLQKPCKLQNLDAGFDVYASQAFNAPDGTAYLISWVGLPDLTYPTDRENWANCLSQVKVLHQKNGQLYQSPVPAMKSLRGKSQIIDGQVAAVSDHAGQQIEVEVTIEPNQQGTLWLAADQALKRGLQVKFDTQNGKLILDRSLTDEPTAVEYGSTREINLPVNEAVKLRIFLDHSLVEIFVNDGAQVMTGRYFTRQSDQVVAFDQPTQVHGSLWQLNKM